MILCSGSTKKSYTLEVTNCQHTKLLMIISIQRLLMIDRQTVTSNIGDKMGLRYAPMAFTENGVAMLSTVLLLYLYFLS